MTNCLQEESKLRRKATKKFQHSSFQKLITEILKLGHESKNKKTPVVCNFPALYFYS